MLDILIYLVSGFFCGISLTIFVYSLMKVDNDFRSEFKSVRSDIKVLYDRLDHLHHHFSLKFR